MLRIAAETPWYELFSRGARDWLRRRVSLGVGHALEDRGPEQEVLHLLRLPLDDLLDEVVDDVAVVPGETGDELRGIVAALHGECGELEGGYPAFGATLQRRDVGLGQLVVGDPALVGLPIVASIRSDNVEGFVRLLEATMDVSAERRGDGTMVLRRSR